MRSSFGPFEEFFRCSYGYVVAFLVAAGFDVEESRDATAEAMVRAYEHWRGLTSPRAWLYTTAYRVAVNAAKRRQDGLDRAATVRRASPTSHVDPYATIDGYSEVQEILSRLPRQQRLVMAWYMHDFKPREIAEALDMPEATARSHLRHGRNRLKKFFDTANGKEESGDDA